MNLHERRYNRLRRMVDGRLRSLMKSNHPTDLAAACRYVLSGGGKRIRSTLVLLSCEAVGGNPPNALNAAVAVELMHNFTLVHDDVMDNAPTRRGRPTVHTKWNVNHALLVGDVLLGMSYKQLLRNSPANLERIVKTFTSGFVDVCEGQALDMEFEQCTDVTVAEYFTMIEKKTARLFSTSTELGAVLGSGSESQIRALRKFGHLLGRAFQLQDDLLDVIGDEADFGKTIGVDILEGKRTFLLLKAFERASKSQRATLMNVLKRKTQPLPRSERLREVKAVAAIYRSSGAVDEAKRRIHRDTEQASRALMVLPDSSTRATLFWLSEMLVKRSY